MSLKGFHIVFIVASTLLAALLGMWCLRLYGEQDGFWTLASCVLSFAAAALLVAYGTWFLRKARQL